MLDIVKFQNQINLSISERSNESDDIFEEKKKPKKNKNLIFNKLKFFSSCANSPKTS